MNCYKLSFPPGLQGVIQLPSSKSISNRALIINSLANGKHAPDNLSDCDDTRVMMKALNSNEGEVIDIMAAGTAMRFLTAYFSVTPGTHVITGTERMRQRPIKILVDALRELGADIEYVEKEGYPPLRITGKELTGHTIRLKGDVSSQYISALLMIAPTLKNGLEIILTGEVISFPYIYMTMQIMQNFGVYALWNAGKSIFIDHTAYKSVPFTVESDWSAASYWYQMVALSEKAEIELQGLFPKSCQGDSHGAAIFKKLGVETVYTDNGVLLKKNSNCVERLEEDFINIPDLAQTFVVTCALLNIPFHFTGLQTLKIKETDRIAALIAEMAKLGYAIREENNAELIWNGERIEPQDNPVIMTYEDHRMAMAFAPAAICYPQLCIAEPHVVSKSYPGYWEDLKRLGVVIDEQ